MVSLLLQLNQSALDLKVVELVPDDDGHFSERAAPTRLTSRGVVLLDVYGSLHYAGARTLQQHLPDPTGTEGAAVVLRMRGRSTLGATFITVVTTYAAQLDQVGARLYLSGVDPVLVAQLERTRQRCRGRSGAALRRYRPDRRVEPGGLSRGPGVGG